MNPFRNRLAKLEARIRAAMPRRVIIATVPPGLSAEVVAANNGFDLLDSDILVCINDRDHDAIGTIREYGR